MIKKLRNGNKKWQLNFVERKQTTGQLFKKHILKSTLNIAQILFKTPVYQRKHFDNRFYYINIFSLYSLPLPVPGVAGLEPSNSGY
jgi:hypothetical protein